ncbi:MAG TPA: FUSC family protein [Rudaea sp.]|nr:FUSC family protein [Rudaea sp.]
MLAPLLTLKPRDVPIPVALRNTAAVTLPLALGLATDHLGVGLGVSVGALNTMFSDQPGPYRQRMTRMLFAAAAAGVSAFVGYTLGGNDVAITLAALIWGFAGGLLVALGPDIGRIGLTSMILLVVTGAYPSTPAEALGPSFLFFSGGLLLTLFAIAAWPLQRYRPERTALAQLCRQLAASARAHDDSAQAPPVTQAVSDVENLLHGSYRARGVAMEAFRVLAEIIERVRLELVALAGLKERAADKTLDTTIDRLREYAARALDAVAAALDAGTSPLAAAAALEGFDAALAGLGAIDLTDEEAHDRRAQLIALAHAHMLGAQLRAAVRNADFAGSRGELRFAADEARLPRALRPRNPLAILRANLRLSSIACRHAIRCGVCLAIAVAGERLSGVSHGYWIPMTTAIVLKPDFAGTFSFGLLRVIGTLLGLALTTALLHFAFGGDWQRIALFAVLCFGFREFTTVHYGIGVMLLTGLIVVLLTFEGQAPAETMLARGIGTSLGSALALLAYIVWPTWEHGRIRATLADMLDAYRRYFAAVLDGEPRARADVRGASRSARTNAQASLDRLRGEPRRDAQLVALAERVFANANRFLRAAMALEAVRQSAADLPARSEVAAFVARTDAELARIAQALRDGSPIHADTRVRSAQRALRLALEGAAATDAERLAAAAWIDASDRIGDSIDTLAHLLRGVPATKTEDSTTKSAKEEPRGS